MPTGQVRSPLGVCSARHSSRLLSSTPGSCEMGFPAFSIRVCHRWVQPRTAPWTAPPTARLWARVLCVTSFHHCFVRQRGPCSWVQLYVLHSRPSCDCHIRGLAESAVANVLGLVPSGVPRGKAESQRALPPPSFCPVSRALVSLFPPFTVLECSCCSAFLLTFAYRQTFLSL